MSKVLLINGSPHEFGCTYTALKEVADTLEKNGVETEFLYLGTKPMAGCIACRSCIKTGRCVFDDEVDRVLEKLDEYQGIVVGSPVYFAGPTGQLCAFLDRLFFAGGQGGSRCGVLPPGRGQRRLRPAEQVFHHQQHACGLIPVLEPGPRQYSRADPAGY